MTGWFIPVLEICKDGGCGHLDKQEAINEGQEWDDFVGLLEINGGALPVYHKLRESQAEVYFNLNTRKDGRPELINHSPEVEELDPELDGVQIDLDSGAVTEWSAEAIAEMIEDAEKEVAEIAAEEEYWRSPRHYV